MPKTKIAENFATPLVGQFLNLPKEPVQITCRACGISAESEIRNDLTCCGIIHGFFFVLFCCCDCMNFVPPCGHTDTNHYCKNCGCYFGRNMKPKANILKDL